MPQLLVVSLTTLAEVQLHAIDVNKQLRQVFICSYSYLTLQYYDYICDQICENPTQLRKPKL